MAQAANLVEAQAYLVRLKEMRDSGGAAVTTGLDDRTIAEFLPLSRSLATAIERAYEHFCDMREARPDLLALDEPQQIAAVQQGIVNFYAIDAVNPYVAAGAAGPWVVSLKGAVIYDCGGYGMLGFGHAPEQVLEAMSGRQVMANVMTPSISQMRMIECLEAEIGHTREGGSPYRHFLCINSGSESVTVASRLADVNAKQLTAEGERHAGKPVRGLALRGSFHGRTDRPARFSDSTLPAYRKYLRSFDDADYLLTVPPNDIEALEAVFADAERSGVFIEAMFVEPVMGEGNPGQGLDPNFYARARELTLEHGALLLVDSIQAGLRAHGVLSVVDYPGFQDLPEPDMETYSKALNAGQYPLSVLAMNERAAELYKTGIYGNTMTSNPRAMDVAVAVLEGVNDDIRSNIVDRGAELVQKLEALAEKLDGAITGVQGTGLLLSCELSERYKCYGAGSTEEYLRMQGLGVIHGGVRSLRFTPSFLMTSAEVDLVVDRVRDALENGPVIN